MACLHGAIVAAIASCKHRVKYRRFALRAMLSVNSSIFSTCPHNIVNFGPLAAEIGLPVWGTLANFNGFRVLTSLLYRRRSMEINQTLHDVWLSPGLLYYTCIWGLFHINGILPSAKFTLRPNLAFSYIGSVTARHASSVRQQNFAAWYLHATGLPSRSILSSRTV